MADTTILLQPWTLACVPNSGSAYHFLASLQHLWVRLSLACVCLLPSTSPAVLFYHHHSADAILDTTVLLHEFR